MSQNFACTLKLNSKKLLESETPSCGFDRVGLKGGQNSLERRESWCACLVKSETPLCMLISKKLEKSESFSSLV